MSPLLSKNMLFAAVGGALAKEVFPYHGCQKVVRHVCNADPLDERILSLVLGNHILSLIAVNVGTQVEMSLVGRFEPNVRQLVAFPP